MSASTSLRASVHLQELVSSIITGSNNADLKLQALSAADKGAARDARPLARPVSACKHAPHLFSLVNRVTFHFMLSKRVQQVRTSTAYWKVVRRVALLQDCTDCWTVKSSIGICMPRIA